MCYENKNVLSAPKKFQKAYKKVLIKRCNRVNMLKLRAVAQLALKS